MQELPPSIYIGIGTLLAAIITGGISLANLIISKEQKISELRQDWINNLRSEIAQYIALVNNLNFNWLRIINDESINPTDKKFSFIKQCGETITKVDTITHKVQLMLNPAEHKAMIETMDAIQDLLSDSENLSKTDQFHKLFDVLHTETQETLKSEWERVKTGEGAFKNLKKGISTTLIILFCLSLVIYLLK